MGMIQRALTSFPSKTLVLSKCFLFFFKVNNKCIIRNRVKYEEEIE